MQTAIEEIMSIVEMDHNNGVEISMSVFYKMLKDKLPTEKQQIINAFNQGYRDAEIDTNLIISDSDISEYADAKNYYNNTFKND